MVDHLTPRNSRDFQSRRNCIDPPHAFRVKFKDATNEWKDAERLIRWPGHTGEITITEALELPGKTRPDEIWREARRRMYEAIYRPDLHEVMQDGPVRVATLSQAPAAGAVLEYAYTGELEATDYSSAWGNIADNCTLPSQIMPGRQHINYLHSFRKVIA
ncbi:hypothetical protein GEU84_019510 [Fertoebacter nigrum]|uniref:Uncharacterized protein n=1 Tax=Fertoeibacter niger TaxID=2656921 RepID=A0A8X8H3D1_9RHOB|nr:hypothetical protein [Fertoeibacter niger]NUB46586.1 hypothetical protein [Fertoeibacter niger]